jgi:hypothetical protein
MNNFMKSFKNIINKILCKTWKLRNKWWNYFSNIKKIDLWISYLDLLKRYDFLEFWNKKLKNQENSKDNSKDNSRFYWTSFILV